MDGDEIRLGETILFFTQKDFPNREDAMSHFKKVGQRANMTKPIEEQQLISATEDMYIFNFPE